MITDMITLAVLLLGALPIVHARECLTNETAPIYAVSHSLTLTSPDQLIPLEDCETLIGDIEIDISFSGSIVLNSVTNFTGQLVSFPDGYNTGLEAIEMRNLRTIQVIRLNRIQGLRSIQMPRLEEVSGKLDFSQEAEDAWMDFSALRSFLMSSMTGTWTNVSFPSLEKVTSSLVIFTAPSTDIVNDRAAVDIDLPALVSVRDLVVEGRIRSLSTPKLERLGKTEEDARPLEVSQGGLLVVSNHTDMSGVFLPSLETLHGRVDLVGHIPTIDLYGLKSTDAAITVNASSPVEIYSAIEQAGDIALRGDLAVVNFTNLTRAANLDINSGIEAHCSASLIHAYRNINYPNEPSFCDAESLALAGKTVYTGSNAQSPSPTPLSTPTPYYNPLPSRSGRLSSVAEAVIAIAVIAAVGCLIGIFLRWRYNMKKFKAAATSTTTTPAVVGGPDTDVLPRHSADDPPPQYSKEP
ncbi:uncharacterized protein APUU_50417S [Aspergillus puulaauensis]|uniref:Uncharacterized protein n=1 Tax=Aspergillus puulaauensis TaxID=1220207 RepID=A0A7R8ANR7_9EURO|nr:uncharacterized protein APUU_50417S [Aspergillus puulaauensis]BCS25706.1 hypothetical protein APUU_50417S [Aspergillus puulaauensis]